MKPRRNPAVPVGLGEADIPYDRSGMAEGISGIPAATGGLKSMKLDFSDPAQAGGQAQIPQGAGVPPAGMQGAIPAAGMQSPQPGPQEGAMSPLLAGLGGQPQQSPDSSMFSDQDLMAMVGQDFDPVAQQGQEMFDASMQDPQIQQQLMLAARRGLGGF